MSAANRIAARYGQPDIDAVRCAHRILLSWLLGSVLGVSLGGGLLGAILNATIGAAVVLAVVGVLKRA